MPHPLARPRSDQEQASPKGPRGIISGPRRPIPPGSGEDAFAKLADHMAGSRAHLDTIARSLARQSGPNVLETATVTIPAASQEEGFEPGAAGVFSQDRYRVPYASVIVINANSTPLVVSSGPAQGSAPGGGQGQFTVPPNSYVAVNISGSSISIYGTVGAVVSYSVMASRIQPSAGALGLAPPGASASTSGSAVDPANGANVSGTISAANLPAGTWSVVVQTYLDGAPTSADDDNMKLNVSGGSQQHLLQPGVANVPMTSPPIVVTLNGTQTINVITAGAGSGAATYHALVVATPVQI